MREDGKTNKQRAKTLQIDKLSVVENPAHEFALAKLIKSKSKDIEKQTFMEALRSEQMEEIIYEFSGKIWDLNRALKESMCNTIKDVNINNKKEVIQSNIADYVTTMTELVNSATFIKSGGNEEMDEKLKKQLEDLQAKLERSESINKMDADVKAHFDSLDNDDQDSFISKSDSERKEIVIKKAEEAKKAEELKKSQEETFEIHGQVIKKSDDPKIFEILKAQNEEIKKAQETARIEKEARELQAFTKKAEEIWPSLPGDPVKKGALLKSINDMPKEMQDTLNGMLKSGNDTNSVMFKEVGQGGHDDSDDPNEKLTKMAKAKAEKDSISFEKAYVEVCSTPEGAELYNKI